MGVLDAFRLDGRVAVVTGGNRGIGLALARALGEAGARVAITVRDPASAPDGVLAVRADVTDPASVREMLGEVIDALGRVDVLVNNAGVCVHRPALEVPETEWRAVRDVNVDGVWNCRRIFGEQMVPRAAGRSSTSARSRRRSSTGRSGSRRYNASKAAVHQLTKSLAAEWAPHGVRVNALAPGYVKTEMAPVDDPQFRRHWIEDAPMQRYAMPEELGPRVVYLASDASAFMTGSVLVVDGGYTLW